MNFLELIVFFWILPSKYFLFWVFPIKYFIFWHSDFKKIPKMEITCQNPSQKGNFHSTCQKNYVTFLLPEKIPKKEIFFIKIYPKKEIAIKLLSQKGNIPSKSLPKRKPSHQNPFLKTFSKKEILPSKIIPKKEIFDISSHQTLSKKGNIWCLSNQPILPVPA